jgi:O-succinylbenzoic acid--CoA ligase
LVENLTSKPSRHSTADAPINVDLDAPLAIVFTSGTSGKPKGATLTYGNFFYSAMASAYRLGTLPDDRWLCVLPLYHVGGLSIVVRCCLYGTTIVLQHGFDMDEFRNAMIAHQITLASLVPTMLYRLIERFGRDFIPDSLRMILLGGAAASPELIHICNELDIPVATTYGLSEATSQVATALPDDVRRKPAAVGKPLMFTSVRIADEDGYSLPVGEYGEIVVSGETVMPGYFNDEGATSIALRGGELYTGDIGYLDDDGDLWVVQRRSDLIVTGGENVYPAEVEQILKRHPAVMDACVVGVDHPEWGQQVTAMIVIDSQKSLSAEELIDFSREHLAGYKQPQLVQFVDHLPQTASGKIHRQSVQQLMSRLIENSNA